MVYLLSNPTISQSPGAVN